jgi:LysR family transcriptional activator of nhaA
MYNYNHLYYFYTTAKSGGVTTAAKHLRISQPSLSGQLKVLEGALGTKLFRKVGRNIELTPEGSVIFGFCRQMFELSEQMKELISNEIPYASRRIYLGVSNEVANSFAVEAVSLFLNKYSEPLRPKVVMVCGLHDRLVEQLRFREIDAVVTHLAMTNSELVNLQRAEIPVALVSSSHRKVRLKKQNSNLLASLEALTKGEEPRWVMPSSNLKLRAEINQFVELNSLKGRIVFESDVIESIVRLVIEEFGFAFLPVAYIKNEIQNKLVLRHGPKTGYWKHRVWLACHSQVKDDRMIDSLSLSFKEACRALTVG